MEEYTKTLQKYLLQKVVFKCDNKILKAGKIKLFNIKQYFIRFSIENDKKEIKQLELPYPYIIHDNPDHCTFNYHISSFVNRDGNITNIIRALNSKDAMRIYDKMVQILPVK